MFGYFLSMALIGSFLTLNEQLKTMLLTFLLQSDKNGGTEWVHLLPEHLMYIVNCNFPLFLFFRKDGLRSIFSRILAMSTFSSSVYFSHSYLRGTLRLSNTVSNSTTSSLNLNDYIFEEILSLEIKTCVRTEIFI